MKVIHYFSLIKFSHTVFALPFAAIGFFFALTSTTNTFNWSLIIYVTLCMIFARSAAMAFNRYLDADIDAKNERTAQREIPRGVISHTNALVFTIITSVLFVFFTYFINTLCFYLSPVALFVIFVYSYTKRVTYISHFVLGLGLALAPIGAYLAVTGEFALVPICFSCIVFTWSAGFDILYALQDEEFDVREGLFSIPAQFGRTRALMISIIVHAITIAFVVLVGIIAQFSFFYWIGAFIFCSLLVYQHMIVSPHDISRINIAFGTSNGIASVLFAVFVIIGFYF